MYQDKEDQGTTCGRCIKYILLISNFIFFLCGGVLVGIGVWLLVDRNYLSAIVGSSLMTVAIWCLIIAGGFIMFVAFFGCYGAYRESKGLLIAYFVLMLLMFLTLITGAVLAVVFKTESSNGGTYFNIGASLIWFYGVDMDRSWNRAVTYGWDFVQETIEEEVYEYMRKTIRDRYGSDLHLTYNYLVTQAWDLTQERLYCCAVDDENWALYRQSFWFRSLPGDDHSIKPYVPVSCCRKELDGTLRPESQQMCQHFQGGPPSKVTGKENPHLHYRGCYEASMAFIEEHSAYVIGLGFAVGFALIGGMVCAIWLFLHVE